VEWSGLDACNVWRVFQREVLVQIGMIARVPEVRRCNPMAARRCISCTACVLEEKQVPMWQTSVRQSLSSASTEQDEVRAGSLFHPLKHPSRTVHAAVVMLFPIVSAPGKIVFHIRVTCVDIVYTHEGGSGSKLPFVTCVANCSREQEEEKQFSR
jgi:hypothetical protein